MYFCDFLTIDGERYFISADTRTRELRFERVTNGAFEKFIRDILGSMELGVPSEKELSA